MTSLPPGADADAAGVQLPITPGPGRVAGKSAASYMMGDAKQPVNIWHWKSDWQLDVIRYRDRDGQKAVSVWHRFLIEAGK